MHGKGGYQFDKHAPLLGGEPDDSGEPRPEIFLMRAPLFFI